MIILSMYIPAIPSSEYKTSATEKLTGWRTGCGERIAHHSKTCKDVSQVELFESKHSPSGEEAQQDEKHADGILYPYFGE